MKYQVDIWVEKEEGLDQYLADVCAKRDRSDTTLMTEQKFGIHIEATDATALRASVDSVCQSLKIWEDTKEVEA